MEYSIDSNEHGICVNIIGRLTYNDRNKLSDLINNLAQISTKWIALDLEALEFIDSAGVGMLLIVREELVMRDKLLIVSKATGQVKRVLTVAQLGKMVKTKD